MALVDLESPETPIYFRNQIAPNGSLPQRYIGPAGATGGMTMLPSPVYNAVPPPINTVAMPRFNLASLFNGGTRAGQTPSMVATTKSTTIQPQINAASATRTSNAGAEQQSLKDYATAVLGGQSQAKAQADQEINSINQIYGSGGDSIEARLAALNRQEQAAQNIAAQRAIGQARRSYNAARAGSGSSSYLDRLLAQRMYGISAQNAGNAAQQGRADLTWLTGQRTGQVGRRQSILDALAQRGLAPVLASQQIEQGALGNLGRLADLDYGNNIYETPEDAYRRQINFLEYLSPYATI